MPYNPSDTILNKYRIEALIGRGAFAEVYLATHVDLNVPRALKVLRQDTPGVGSSLFDDYEQRFRLEVQLGARLNHPNVIQVHDVERDGEDLILVMEYAPKGSLAERLKLLRDGVESLSIEEALKIAVQVANGLGKLHSMDVVHRDLKPSNILFDADGVAKVADFGLAQVPGGPSMRSQISTGVPHPGTPGYMSLEQKNSRDYLTSASDVYTLGAVLFEMLSGRISSNQRANTRVRSLRPDIPKWLDELIAQMLSDVPQERPWDGEEVARLLREGQPKRKLFLTWVVAVVSAMIVVGILFGLYYQGGGWQVPELRNTTVVRADVLTSPPSTITYTPLATETVYPTATAPAAGTATRTGTDSQTQQSTNTLVPEHTNTQSELSEASPIIQSEIDNMDLVWIGPFWIDKTPITNAIFQQFVDETGYITDAEKAGIGYVWQAVVSTAEWTKSELNYDGWEWKVVAGATWQNPQGSGSYNNPDDPVVQVSWNDASAYCDWAERSLLTWADWNVGITSDLVVRLMENQIFDPGEYYTVSEWFLDEVDNTHNLVVWEGIVISWNSAPFLTKGWTRNRSNDHLTFRCGKYENSEISPELSNSYTLSATPEMVTTPLASSEENLHFLRITNSCDSDIMVALTKSGQTETFYRLSSGGYRVYSQEAGSYQLDVRGSWLEKHIWDGSIQIPEISTINVLCSSVEIN
jgi:serine/threonine protein kinase